MSSNVSVFLCGILRHRAVELGLPIDLNGGWMDVSVLIRYVNNNSKFHLTKSELEEIVRSDEKGRYRFNENHTKIRCCQGHSIPGVIPVMTEQEPPEYLYHGTTTDALSRIEHSGSIEKMKRHGVHLQAVVEKAWQSAERRSGFTPVILRIAAGEMHRRGIKFYVSDNDVWITDSVPVEFIAERIYYHEVIEQ